MSGSTPTTSRTDAPSPGSRRSPRFSYSQNNIFIYIFFLFFIMARYVHLGSRRDIFATLRIEFLMGGLLGAICIYLLMNSSINWERPKKIIIAIALLFAAMIIQLPFAADPLNANMIFNDRVVKFSLQTFFMIVLIKSPKEMRWFLFAFLFASFFVIRESVQGLISGSLIWENQGVMRLHGSVPIYNHPNSLAGLCMGTVPFVAFLFQPWKNWPVRLMMIVGVIGALVCVIYSGSRTSYLGIIAFLMYWFWISRNKKRWLMTGIVLIIALLPIVPDQYKERFTSITGEEKQGHSRLTRMQIAEDAWTIFLENPSGVGVASFSAVRQQRFGRMQDTHNLYLEVATNLGIQGFVVFIFLIYTLFDAYSRSRKSYDRQIYMLRKAGRPPNRKLAKRFSDHRRDLQFLIMLSHAAAAFIIIRLVLGIFGMDLYEIYWWFGAGLGVCLLQLTVSTRRVTDALLAAAVSPLESSES